MHSCEGALQQYIMHTCVHKCTCMYFCIQNTDKDESMHLCKYVCVCVCDVLDIYLHSLSYEKPYAQYEDSRWLLQARKSADIIVCMHMQSTTHSNMHAAHTQSKRVNKARDLSRFLKFTCAYTRWTTKFKCECGTMQHEYIRRARAYATPKSQVCRFCNQKNHLCRKMMRFFYTCARFQSCRA
jgi:hypothetical protein